MITSFEVGAVFKIINQASPALTQILRQIRELNVAIDKARQNLASIGKGAATGLTSALAETDRLAAAWGDVAKNAGAARIAIGNASAANARAALRLPGAGGTGGGGSGRGGGRGQPGWMRGGAHVTGPSALIPGGGHVRFGGGAAMAGAGLLGYGAYQAAEMEDAVFQLIYHSGLEQNDGNRSMFRKVLQDSMSESGYSLHDISESAKQEIRMFQGTKGGGIDVLPEMLRAATIESRLKGESPEASMKALIGLAHMTKQYSPDAIKKLAPAFAFLSTANPSSLGSIEKAAGYAVPLLQSGLEIDPMQSLLLGTALTRAGATSTKSGTWLREMALRAMPGTSMMSKMAFKKHEQALKELGLVDENHNPTWFTDGKPDLLKMLDIGGTNAQKIPLTRRAGLERQLFGAQGGGGFALLADPAVREQVQTLMKEMNSPEFRNRYAGFSENYKAGSTVQNARTAMADFNITAMELGKITLPAINGGLKDFKSVLEGIRGVLPGTLKPGAGTKIATRAGEGAIAGAAWGFAGGPYGVLGGAAIGGIIGGAGGVAEQYMGSPASGKPGARYEEKHSGDPSLLGAVVGLLKSQADEKHENAGARYERRMAEHKAGGAPQAKLAPLALTLNIDGRTLAEALSKSWYSFPTQAPAADGMGQYFSGDHNTTDK